MWRFYVAGNKETFLSLHVKCPTFCPILTQYGRARQIFVQVPSIKFHVKRTLEDALKHAGRQMDGHDEINVFFATIRKRLPLTSHPIVATSLRKIIEIYAFPRDGFSWLVAVQGGQK